MGGWVFGQNFGTLVIPKDFTRNYDVSGLYGGTTSKFVRDKHGLRGSYEDVSKIDILTIGGSTTNEIFVSEGKTWSDQLQAAFRKSGRDLVIVNGGVDGQSTIGHLKNFDLWFPKIPSLKARYILAYIGINDYGVMVTGYHGKQDDMEAPRRKVKRYLLNNSVLYTLFRNLRGIWRAKKANLIHKSNSYDGTDWQLPTQQPSLGETVKLLESSLDEYKDRLNKLIKVIRAFGAKPIIVTQHLGAYRIRDGKVWGKLREDGTVDTSAYNGLSVINIATIATCNKAGAICIDLANELFFVDGDHYDGVHTTPMGSKKIGQYLFKKLERVFTKP
jgi:lysophospholipase L1-like esterase